MLNESWLCKSSIECFNSLKTAPGLASKATMKMVFRARLLMSMSSLHGLLVPVLFATRRSDMCIKFWHILYSAEGKATAWYVKSKFHSFGLWCILSSWTQHFFLAKQIAKVAKALKGMVVMGGLITPIVLTLGINPHGVEQTKGSIRLDIKSCLAIKMIVREGDVYCLTFYSSNFTLQLPN